MTRHQTTLTELARLGFAELNSAAALLTEASGDIDVEPLLPMFASSANPDQALRLLVELLRQSPSTVRTLVGISGAAHRLIRVLGASSGLGEFFQRHPEELAALHRETKAPPTLDQYRADLLAVAASEHGNADDAAWNAVRVRYRRHLVGLTSFDLEQQDPLGGI